MRAVDEFYEWLDVDVLEISLRSCFGSIEAEIIDKFVLDVITIFSLLKLKRTSSSRKVLKRGLPLHTSLMVAMFLDKLTL